MGSNPTPSAQGGSATSSEQGGWGCLCPAAAVSALLLLGRTIETLFREVGCPEGTQMPWHLRVPAHQGQKATTCRTELLETGLGHGDPPAASAALSRAWGTQQGSFCSRWGCFWQCTATIQAAMWAPRTTCALMPRGHHWEHHLKMGTVGTHCNGQESSAHPQPMSALKWQQFWLLAATAFPGAHEDQHRGSRAAVAVPPPRRQQQLLSCSLITCDVTQLQRGCAHSAPSSFVLSHILCCPAPGRVFLAEGARWGSARGRAQSGHRATTAPIQCGDQSPWLHVG